MYQSINQSTLKFVGRRYTRRPGVPTVVSGTHDQKVHSCMLNTGEQGLRVNKNVESFRRYAVCRLLHSYTVHTIIRRAALHRKNDEWLVIEWRL